MQSHSKKKKKGRPLNENEIAGIYLAAVGDEGKSRAGRRAICKRWGITPERLLVVENVRTYKVRLALHRKGVRMVPYNPPAIGAQSEPSRDWTVTVEELNRLKNRKRQPGCLKSGFIKVPVEDRA